MLHYLYKTLEGVAKFLIYQFNQKNMSLQITNKDIILLGHGNYSGGGTITKLPENIDLYILQPLGYTLRTDVAAALIKQKLIKKLILHHETGSDDRSIAPNSTIFSGGEFAPDFKMYDLGHLSDWGKETIGDKKNIVTVKKPSLLSELIRTDKKINEALKLLSKDEKLKLYWSACDNQIRGNSARLK